MDKIYISVLKDIQKLKTQLSFLEKELNENKEQRKEINKTISEIKKELYIFENKLNILFKDFDNILKKEICETIEPMKKDIHDLQDLEKNKTFRNVGIVKKVIVTAFITSLVTLFLGVVFSNLAVILLN